MSETEPPERRGDSGDGSGSSESAESSVDGEVATPTTPLEISLGFWTGIAFALAVVAVGAAALIVWRPSLVDDSPAVFIVVTATGVVTAFLGGRAIYRQIGADAETVDTPLVEYRATTRVPGEEVDATLLRRSGGGLMGGYEQQKAVTERLRDLVTAALGRDGHDEDEAERRIENETWTENPVAAGFFTFGSAVEWLDRLRLRLTGVSLFAYQARHAVDAVADRLSVPDREWTDPESVGDVAAVTEGWPGRTTDMDLSDRETRRWRVVGGLGLLAIGLGAIVREPGLVLAAAIAAGALAYGTATATPAPKLAVRRELEATDPEPGAAVRVTVTVRNTGESLAMDLRLVDGVPADLLVTEGTPRHGTVLQPGASATYTYAVEAVRGTHEFDPLGVIARDASGSVERTATVGVTGDTAMACAPRPTQELDVPVRSKTTRDVGRIVTDSGGSGIEFHSVREYRQGDPLKRIDWSRVARGGDLATLQFNVERSTTVVLLVDARTEAFLASDREAPSAVERSLGAASEMFVGLLDGDDRVGLASVGPESCWLAPGAGEGHWALARDLLTDDGAFSRPDPERSFYAPLAMRTLRKKLPADSQLIVFSALPDRTSVEMTRRLHAYGYPTTVVSPDTTGTESPGRTVAHLERRLRLSRLREADVRVIDWAADEPLETAVDRAHRRWSR
jgi:uncharacterized protein (DUF58 family)